MDAHAQIQRNSAAIIFAALGGKERIEKIWPLFSDKRGAEEKFVMTPEMYALIKKAHNLN